MLEFKVVRTKAGRVALAFDGYCEHTQQKEQFLIWYDAIDGMTVSQQFSRINHHEASLTIETIGDQTTVEVVLNEETVQRIKEPTIVFRTLQR